MKPIWKFMFTLLPALASGAHAQDISAPSDVLDKLKQQEAGETRKATVVPAPSVGNAGAGATDAAKLRSVQMLIEQVEENRGAQAGTVKAMSNKGATISLQHDLTKIRQNFQTISDAPFGSSLMQFQAMSGQSTAVTPANVEYRAKNTADAVEQVTAIKSKNSVAANAFVSGRQPLSLKVQNADLMASQVASDAPEPTVKVQVGGETRELNVGDVSRFGGFEVKVLASANRSGKKTYEGLPYALRIQVMPVQ